MIIRAKAKINLFLHINNILQNNYHSLQSLVCFASNIYDEININKNDTENHQVSFIGGFASDIDSTKLIDNLLLSLPLKNKYFIEINKNIPVGAGLGGGSSDVAAILKYLIKIENLVYSADEIQKLCLKFGADVHVCYYEQSAFIEGCGEILTLCNILSELHLVLVNPMISLLTKDIFSKLNQNDYIEEIRYLPKEFFTLSQLVDFLKNQGNTLEIISKTILNEVNEIIDKISITEQCCIARMSGSGATCFGLYSTKFDAEKAMEKLKNIFPKFWIKYVSVESDEKG